MDLDSLDQRIRLLERELARARWRTRAVCAAAIGAAVVFACKSKAADDKPPPPPILEVGNIKLDGLDGTITAKFGDSAISISPIGGFIYASKRSDGTVANHSLGPFGVQLRTGEGAIAELSALGTQARLGLRTKLGVDEPSIDLVAADTMTSARFGAQQRELTIHVDDLGASLDLRDGAARIRSSVNGKPERGYAVVNASVDKLHAGIEIEDGKVSVGPQK